ncbi:hypothetical protein Ahy_B10g106347 [Arachis hypogaea]|uniref:Pectinesterase n=1 Tax=Arachis hypogaea TaxID=3818 RepID=A0A444XAJ3_ARAHY|nr:hypothetical protein Ahy_B10g106347 [Arachis hypogaea]
MLLFLVRWWIYVFVLLNSGAVNSQNYRTVRDKILPFNKVVVDSLGHGNFSTIQSAIDSVPSNNKYWILINVTAGIYREKVTIPIDKPYIILKGSGKMRTWVEWDDHNTTAQSPTFQSDADNSCNDKVGFFGLQDTLWDNYGKHYYKFCTIEGAVDFIFGAGQSLFERCSINVIGRALGKWFVGYITAQARENPKDSNGFVFKNCNVSGNGSTFLGRPWRPYAKVLFYNTSMANIIQPAGWDLWDSSQHENNIMFAEYGNFGPGSNTSKRVNWTTTLDLKTVDMMTNISFIDSEGWVHQYQQF